MKIEFSVQDNSQIFNSIHTMYTRFTKVILKRELCYFSIKGCNSGFSFFASWVLLCTSHVLHAHLK